jgi:hypothetical protein
LEYPSAFSKTQIASRPGRLLQLLASDRAEPLGDHSNVVADEDWPHASRGQADRLETFVTTLRVSREVSRVLTATAFLVPKGLLQSISALRIKIIPLAVCGST